MSPCPAFIQPALFRLLAKLGATRDSFLTFENCEILHPGWPSCTLLNHVPPGPPPKVCDPHDHGRDNPRLEPIFALSFPQPWVDRISLPTCPPALNGSSGRRLLGSERVPFFELPLFLARGSPPGGFPTALTSAPVRLRSLPPNVQGGRRSWLNRKAGGIWTPRCSSKQRRRRRRENVGSKWRSTRGCRRQSTYFLKSRTW
jgi:hypothetical protein